MGRIGIIGGTVFLESDMFKGFTKRRIRTSHGDAFLFESENALFIQRHGEKDTPPHMINHKANIKALKESGVTKIIGINSVGSLKKDIPPGAIVIPDDYMQLSEVPTFFDNELRHITPRLSDSIRKSIFDASEKLGIQLIKKGILLNTKGPRLETKAEIRMFRNFADVIGMTMGHEATLAQELGIEYASICSVDNFANGISDVEIDYKGIKRLANENSSKIMRIVKRAIERRN